MAKKATPPHSAKKAGRQGDHAQRPGRRYSLDDILGEYRAHPKAAGKASPASVKSEEGSQQRRREDVSSFGEELRRESKAKEKQLPEAEAAPLRSEEEKAERQSKAKKGQHKAPKKKNSTAAEEQDGKAPSAERTQYRPGGDKRNPFHRLYGWLLGRAAVIAIKKRMKAEQEQAEARLEPEISAYDAAKVYASQLPAFQRRSRSAALLSLLCVWIALAWGADIPIPGALGRDIWTASAVSLVLLLSVMLMGLDVVTIGILTAFKGKPGMESLLSAACLASLTDCVFVLVRKDSAAALPPCAVCCAGITLALRCCWYRCRSLKSAFLTLHKNKNVFTVNGEKLPSREGKFLLKSRRSTAGFIRGSEEHDICEQTERLMAPFVLLLSLLLSVLACLKNGFSALPHCFAVLSALGGCSAALMTLPMLQAPINERLAKTGAALGGWSAIEELGKCRHLIITDSDLFPEGSTAFYSVRILNAESSEQVISRTGSIVAAVGTELAGLFADLMERSGARTVPVLDFLSEDGGAGGNIDGVLVHVGNAGYMYYHGVKLDPKLIGDNMIYTAFDHQLVGAFGVEYTPDPKVAAALRTLQRSGRKPVFAPRDFNIDEQLVERLFRCKTDGFDFPDREGRDKLRQSFREGNSAPAAIVSSGGLDVVTDLFDTSRYLSRCGRILRILCLVSTALGLLLGFIFCLRGAWDVVSATRLLLYLLFWLLPGLGMSVKTGG